MRKHIKLFESQEQEIHTFMKKHEIENYTITPEGIDVHQDVDLYNCELPELPFQFNVIHGNFSCSGNKLTSLRGAPRVVQGYFSCADNKLKSLHDIPKFVQGDFYCAYTHNAKKMKVPPWEYRFLLFSEIQGEIETESKALDEFFRKYKNKKSLIPQALKELRTLTL